MTVTGGRLTGVLCGPCGVGVGLAVLPVLPVEMFPEVEPVTGVGDALATVPPAVELAAS